MTRAAATRTFVNEVWDRAFLPPPMLTVSQWADQNRTLSTKETGVPGPWRTARVPYLEKIMDALSPSSVAELVVFQKGAQIGGSEAGLNWLGYTIDRDPSPVMLVMPTKETGQDYSHQRLSELIRQTRAITGKVSNRRDPEGGSTQLRKDFPGGMLLIRGSNAPSGLRSNPIKKLLLEEVDAYEPSAGAEGDPVTLARMRTATFRRRKEFMVSTPKLKGGSRIEREFKRCEQAWKFQVPCTHCGHRQELVWEQMRYELPPGWSLEDDAGELVEIPGVEYECIACHARMADYEKAAFLAAGDWVPLWNRGQKSIAFHLSALYSPWFSWGRAASMFERGRQRPEEMQVFVNTVLGLPYEEPSEAPDWTHLYARRETYLIGTVPAGVRFLTAGMDVQHDRLCVEVVGWGREKRSWSIDYRELPCDITSDEPQRLIRELLETPWPCAGGGELPIHCLAIDSSDSSTTVYKWCRNFPAPAYGGAAISIRHPGAVMAVKGRAAWGKPLLTPEKVSAEERKRGLRVVGVSTWTLKRELYLWLRLRGASATERASGIEDPYGFCHFPEYAEEWFQQLTAERLETKRDKRGYDVQGWVKTRARNEALDCRVYARAAAVACGLDRLLRPQDWGRIERGLPAGLLERAAAAPVTVVPLPADGPTASVVAAPTPPPPAPVGRRSVIRSSWMGRVRH